MNDYYAFWEHIIGTLAFVQACFVLGVSIGILPFYLKHKAIRHISMVATSYVILTAIVAASINFHIFVHEHLRGYGLLASVIAFAFGNYALIKVFRVRSLRWRLEQHTREVEIEEKETGEK